MKPREIEQTSKKLKAHILCCYLLGIFGALILFCAEPWQVEQAIPITVVFWFTGMVWYLITKFRIWWNHR